MRLRRTKPETERGVLRFFSEEVGEVGGVIARVDAGRHGLGMTPLVKLTPARIALEAQRAPVARCPALACEADEVARVLQQVCVQLQLGGH